MSKQFEIRLGPVISGWTGEQLANRPARPSRSAARHQRRWATSTRRDRVKLSGSAEQRRRKRILKRDMGDLPRLRPTRC
jgi:hypothetical protein